MIRVTYYQHEAPFTTFTDDREEMADCYIQFALVCGYGVYVELI